MLRTLIGGRTILLCAALSLALAARCLAQSPPDPSFERKQVIPSFQAFQSELKAIAATSDASARKTQLDALWSKLRSAGQVPFAHGNQYAMLYRGEADRVSFAGDHTNWQPSATATRLPGTDLWVHEGTLPADARIDYKIVVNGRDWRLDTANPLLMWSGFGPNSELRMPEYKYPRETIRRPGVGRGQLRGDTRLASTNLGYDLQYRVYTPAGYDEQQLADLPVVYVADGHEYAADHVGSMIAVLDNMIDAGALRPTIAVFIDPRDPNNPANNRRIAEYNMNPKFAAFVADELVPAIDRAYRTSAGAEGRVILGTSMGGLNAAFLGATRSDVFHRIGIQSPAFKVNPNIYKLYDQPPAAPLKIFMTAGTINDGDGGTAMSAILAKQGYDFTFTQANEGHSWGNWRARLADLLTNLLGPPNQSPTDFAAGNEVWRAQPGKVYNSHGGGRCRQSAASENSSCRCRAERRQLRGNRRPLGGGLRSFLGHF